MRIQEMFKLLKAKKRLTWEQIEQYYPGKWIRIEDVEYRPGNSGSVSSGIVTRVTTRPRDKDLLDVAKKLCAVRYVESPHALYVGCNTIS